MISLAQGVEVAVGLDDVLATDVEEAVGAMKAVEVMGEEVGLL